MDCQWFKKAHCTSCTLLDIPYSEGLLKKELLLKSLIPEVEGVLLPTVSLKESAGSRSKAKLALARREGKIAFGFYDEKGNFKQLEHCPLHRPELNSLLPVLSQKLEKYKIEPYDLTTRLGEVKYVILSQSESHGEILLRFTLRSKESLDRLKKLSAELLQENKQVKVITANLQPVHSAQMEGDEEIVLSAETMILHQFGTVKLNLGPRSFFQVTPAMAMKLYSSVGELVKKQQISSFLDLYCGVGAFSFFAAQNASRVMGVEISPEAIKCAESSLAFNPRAGSLEFKSVDVEKFLAEQKENFEAIMVNPPRRGLNESIINSLLKNNPDYLFYSSCNAHTLSRDHEVLSKNYKCVSAQIFDMFPFTEHFETLIFYRRK